ncbi:MAG: HEPN domain-containing protein [Nitrososphaeria archaeon]
MLSIVKGHLDKALERLKVAERLFSEGYYEDAVSRAYYAMYHAAKAVLATVNVFPKTHEGVVAEFGRRFVLSGVFPKELGKSLADVKASRETYEYSVTAIVDRMEAEAILSDAKVFVNKVKEYLTRKSEYEL